MKWGLPILQDEIKRVKPKIIVCLGKPVFDLLHDVKISFDDAHGGWFWSEEYKAFLYVMYAPGVLIGKPEYYEQFKVDFEEVHRQLCRVRDGKIDEHPIRYSVIRDDVTLRDWVAQMQEEGHKLFAVDCEWHGRNYLDGKLRTIQFAWTESDAVVIEFRDEQNWFSFQIEGELKNDPFEMTLTRPGLGEFGPGTESITDVAVAEAEVKALDDDPNTPQWIKEANQKALQEAKQRAFGPIEDDPP